MDFERVWLPYLYLYGLGGVLFVTGLIVCVRGGQLNLQTRAGRRWLAVLIAGFVFYASIHLVVILLALAAEGGS